MKTIQLFTAGTLLLLGVLPACKKEETTTASLSMQPVTVDKISRTIVQAGDTLIVYGKQLVQDNLQTEIFISDKPAAIIRQSADSITVVVPAKVHTGKVVVNLSSGQQFSSVEGPQVEVKPTPLVKSYWPVYAYGGETIELYTENFSNQESDNAIFLGRQPVQIVGRKGKDTLLVKLPADAVTGLISWRTYKGPVFKMEGDFWIRQKSYPVTTVGEWLTKDPAFTYVDSLVRGYPVLAGGNYDLYKRTYDAALNYILSPDRPYTIFLSSDISYLSRGIAKDDFIEMVKSKPYNYNIYLIAAIVPDHTLQLSNLQDGDMYNTAFTMRMQWYPDGTDTDANYVQIVEQGGEKYAQIYGMYNESRPPVKILREHHVGNATIIEIDGELGYVYF